ncbi:MAG: class I mannose-6-phosphate isomerase [Acidobacteriota bacterium]|nr:class I mannose-6-phosphate isomerase [Acidobacteriota bacterium]
MPRIWGARSLAPIYPDQSNLPEPIGEAWLTGPLSEIAEGPFQGTLNSAWTKMPAQWRGSDFAAPPAASDFPLLVKFIFPTDQLSIQVHPNDAYAAEHEAPGSRGKTEMWHAISADPGATLLLGLAPQVDPKQFEAAIENGGLENFFKRLPVSAGDTFYVPAGTPHTIGKGMVLCEVQQNSDLTYRLYDFQRVDAQGHPRQLHVEKGMAVIDFEHRLGVKVAPLALPSSHSAKKSLLVACRYFASERWDLSATTEANSDPLRFELFIVLGGGGKIAWDGDSASYRQGDCWFIPAQLGKFSFSPDAATSLLRTQVPDISHLRAHLLHDGIAESALQKVFFP